MHFLYGASVQLLMRWSTSNYQHQGEGSRGTKGGSIVLLVLVLACV